MKEEKRSLIKKAISFCRRKLEQLRGIKVRSIVKKISLFCSHMFKQLREKKRSAIERLSSFRQRGVTQVRGANSCLIKIIKDRFLSYHRELERSSGIIKKIGLYARPLFRWYIILTVSYIVFRREELYRINLLFWILVPFSSIWFILGPWLVHRFYQAFVTFQNDEDIPESVRDYFIQHKDQHLTLFFKYRFREGMCFIVIAIGPILLYPEILTKNVTSGYGDLFFWVFILFLARFIFYCANATAYITLLCLCIIKDLDEKVIFKYDPRNKNNKYVIKMMKDLCGKASKYTASAAIFIPLGVYYFAQQPELVINEGRAHILFTASSALPAIVLAWIVLMMLFYSVFLLTALFYPKRKINLFVEKKNDMLLDNAQGEFVKIETIKKEFSPNLARSSYVITEYLKLQEIRLLCKKDRSVDLDSVLTVIAAIASFIAAIPGIIQLIKSIA